MNNRERLIKRIKTTSMFNYKSFSEFIPTLVKVPIMLSIETIIAGHQKSFIRYAYLLTLYKQMNDSFEAYKTRIEKEL